MQVPGALFEEENFTLEYSLLIFCILPSLDAEAYTEPCRTSKVECFAKQLNG